MNRLAFLVLLGIAVFIGGSFIKPALSHPAEVRSVVPENVNGNTQLRITIWHDVETGLHYVNVVEVTYDTNTTSMTLTPQILENDGTFTVTYYMGPIPGAPTITVRAACTLTGYSGAVSWVGQIPEFASVGILVSFMIVALIVGVAFKKRTLGGG